MIRVENIQKQFHKKSVLQMLNLEFEDTGLVCITGESGSGKTTLLKVIGGILPFEDGRVVYDDSVILDAKSKKRPSYCIENMTCIMEDQGDYKGLTVYEGFRRILDVYELSEQEIEDRISYALEKTHMQAFRHRRMEALSGGQKQRIRIAGALLKQSKVVLADEPTANLDEKNTIAMLEILRGISRECLVLVVSHEKRLMEAFADRMIYLSNGQVLRDDTNVPGQRIESLDLTHIYLGEYDRSTHSLGGVSVDYYEKKDSRTEDAKHEPSRIRMINRDGILIIQKPATMDVIIEKPDEESLIVEGKRPEYERTEVEVQRPEGQRRHRMALCPRRKSDPGSAGSAKHSEIAVLVMTIVSFVFLTMLFISNMAEKSIDREQYQTVDSHVIAVDMSKISDSEAQELYDTVFGQKSSQILLSESGSMNICYEGYPQLQKAQCNVKGFSVVPLSDLSSDNLVAGRMPKEYHELVIDRQLLERAKLENHLLAELFPEEEDIIGKQVYLGALQDRMKIVGLCDTGEPDVYAYDSVEYAMSYGTGQIAMDSEVTDSDSLEPDQVILSEKYWEKEGDKDSILESLKKMTSEEMTIVRVDTSLDADIVVSRKTFRRILRQETLNRKKLFFYSMNPQKDIQWMRQTVRRGNFSGAVEVASCSEQNLERLTSRNLSVIRMDSGVLYCLEAVLAFMTVFVFALDIRKKRELVRADLLNGYSVGWIWSLMTGRQMLRELKVCLIPLGMCLVASCISRVRWLDYYVELSIPEVCGFVVLMMSGVLAIYGILVYIMNSSLYKV